MSLKSIEDNVANIQGSPKEGKRTRSLESNYQHYLELGGIVNEKDYRNALDRISIYTLDRKDSSVRHSIQEVLDIARYAGIELNDSEDILDPRIVLYVKLRGDAKPANVDFHHSQMSDQRLFGEVLLMLEDTDSFEKLTKAYSYISFK